MIIEDIVQKGKEIIVETTEGKSKFDFPCSIDLKKYKGLELNNVKDFNKIKNEFVERLVLKSIKQPWKFIDSEVKSLPRPLSVVYSKSKGIKEFLVMSFDSKSVVKSCLVNQEISKKLQKKVNDDYTDEEILVVLQQICESVSARVGFKIRMGINVNALRMYKNKEYHYGDRVFNFEEQYDYLLSLVNRFDLCYIEKPFIKENKKFVDEVRGSCFVCSGNALLLDTLSVSKLVKEFKFTPILVYQEKLSLDLAVGFSIFVLKIGLGKKNCLKEYEKIIKQIKTS